MGFNAVCPLLISPMHDQHSLKARIEAVYPLIGSVASASICMLLYTIFQLTRLKKGPDRKFRPFPMWKTFST